MLDASKLPLANEVARLRELTHADAAAYAAGTEDAAVRAYAHLPAPEYTTESVIEMIDGEVGLGLDRGDLAVLAVAHEATNEFAGSLVLFDLTDAQAEVGFWVHPASRGRGMSGAALELAARFSQLSGLSKLTARTVIDNAGSQRVLAAAGFELIGSASGTTPSGDVAELLHYELSLPSKEAQSTRTR
ncbi:GNAT family N-acetyltransferase [Tessaracoccus rhinocerotis]|uniref:GNAT family N-acetyltransferase n=1 Tax=Tessaracoccus rhinocerotis TaxID=1689449 RepID=A0A553K0F8_9ACTN|nr:GNAT family protein [Tessaracoccus rhinocerotis]TRY18175.1 GNAT family N-acetyltransferase [Tessaracoccus rhinocerotis]